MILSIESSCDDSSIALTEIDTKTLIWHKKISQSNHSAFGGVVPELAAREHAKALPVLLEEVLEHCKPSDIKAIAVTHMPGLSVSLLEGVMMAKALSVGWGLPLIGVNHLMGHIYSLFIGQEAVLPQIVLLVSGGHTAILQVDRDGFKVLAKTLDDSVGESYDKVAKMLDLGYPGGPAIERLAAKGNPKRFGFKRPLNNKTLAFSYSGLKNALRLCIEDAKTKHTLEQDMCDICASFEATATAHLVHKVRQVFVQDGSTKDFAIVGGVSANAYIRSCFDQLCDEFDKALHTPKLEFCSDNAAMIGRYGVELYRRGAFTPHGDLEVYSRVL